MLFVIPFPFPLSKSNTDSLCFNKSRSSFRSYHTPNMRQDTNICFGIYLSAARSHIVTISRWNIKFTLFLMHRKILTTMYWAQRIRYQNDEKKILFLKFRFFLSALLSRSAWMRQLVSKLLSSVYRSKLSAMSDLRRAFLQYFYFISYYSCSKNITNIMKCRAHLYNRTTKRI